MGSLRFQDITQFYSAVSAMSYEDKINNARIDVQIIIEYLTSNGKTYKEAHAVAMHLAADMISLDNKLSINEHQTYCDIFDDSITYGELLDGLRQKSVDLFKRNEFFRFFEEAPNNVQTAIIVLAIVIFSSDGELDSSEYNIFQKLTGLM